MALSTDQIISIATQIAKVPGFTVQALQLLNSVLQELAQDYDFSTIRKTATFQFNTAATQAGYSYAIGSGPNVMPSDFLRLCPRGSYYMISGVPYNMIAVEQNQFDNLVQQAGLNSFPTFFYIDHALTPPALFIWPPPSGGFQTFIRYQSLPADITDTTQTPWFPNSTYLYTRLAGELMKLSNDDRWSQFLSDTEGTGGAGEILRKYLRMKEEPNSTAKKVTLDQRNFGSRNWSSLPNTKSIGW